MRHSLSPCFRTRALAALAAASLAAAAPALAQPVEELTVVGRRGADGEPSSLSRAVSYADLDLTTMAGRDELKLRIQTTARDLCKELGEPRNAVPPAPSCEDAAVKDAMVEAKAAIASARPRG